MSVDARIAAAHAKIIDDLRACVSTTINTVITDAYRRLSEAAATPGEIGLSVAVSQHVGDKLVEVLREIASHTVEQFERRTGQAFWWTEAEEPAEPAPEDALMHFSLDEKGNVIF